MDSGKLDRKITIERFGVGSPATNDFGEPSGSWGTLSSVWAKRETISDGERWRAGEINAQITDRFVIRYSTDVSDVDPTDRIAWEGRVYNIFGVKEIGRREFIEITAAARNDG